MHKSRRVKITDINPHLTCVLCSGYLIDATTIIECLHSFCRTCIVKYLESNKYCPICDVQVHKTKPLLNIRSDQTLQDIVYKLVPGLFQNEMCRRREFYAKHPEQKPPSPEECGEVTQYSHIYTADESISLSLEYYNNNISYDNDNNTAESKMQAHPSRRFLRCPAAVSVSHLQKLIRAKYGLSTEHRVDILYMNDRLSEDFTLMDIAYIYLWRRKGPLHLTYRIFEVAKRIKLNDSDEKSSKIKSEKTTDEEVKNEWKEVQLQISENGIMSVTNINESKPTETVTANVVELKAEINLLKTDLPELSPIPKTEKPLTEETPVENKEKEIKAEEPVVKLGKHKLQDTNENDTSAKLMKPNSIPVPIKPVSTPVKNVQQLSRNHPLKIHSQSVTNKNHINSTPVSNKTVSQKIPPVPNTHATTKSINNNNNTAPKVAISVQSSAPVTVQNSSPVQNTPNSVTPKTSTAEKTAKTVVSTTNAVISSINTNTIMPNSPKYTQAGQSNNTITTKADDMVNSVSKTPISSSAVVPVNNCIQSSKVSIVPKKSPMKTAAYKTLRDPPKAWNPQIPRQNLTKTTVYPSNNGASTSDLNRVEKPTLKPAKFFKMRNNVPRYLGNPASGVKPMYQVREGDKSPSDVKKQPEVKKPFENKLNNNNKDEKSIKSETTEVKNKIEIKKQSIIKVDPKTLKPISHDSTASCSDNAPEMKINQSTVPIFNPLRTQKSQTSPKVDRRSPKTPYTDMQNPPKSPMDRTSPKSGKPLNSPTSKKDKLSLNFTPPNPFIPNLTSPNLAPNQFLYPNFASYDPRVMNNLPAYNPYSMFYSQPRLNYPGLSAQNLPLSPNLMSSLNLEVNKNLRKNYEMSLMQLSPTMDVKKPATCVKSPRESYSEEKTNSNNEKPTESKFPKNNSTNKSVKTENVPKIEPKTDPPTKKEEKPATETSEQKNKTETVNHNEKPKIETTESEKKEPEKEKKEIIQENVDKNKDNNQEKSKESIEKSQEKMENKEKTNETVKQT